MKEENTSTPVDCFSTNPLASVLQGFAQSVKGGRQTIKCQWTPNQAPQPKTFAPSREDILQTLAYFFGAPVSRTQELRGAPCDDL